MTAWPGNAHKEKTSFGGLRRGQLMARVRSAGNKTTEERLASLLREHRILGWRRHIVLPGKPDFCWPNRRLTVFVDGCFWHGHNCGRNLTPKTNPEAWREKIRRNRARDRRINGRLQHDGWKVLRIWECLLSKNADRCLQKIQNALRELRA